MLDYLADRLAVRERYLERKSCGYAGWAGEAEQFLTEPKKAGFTIIRCYEKERINMRLKDKISIVTGGGKGIGREIALGLAKEGSTVVICSRTLSDLDQAAAEIKKTGGKAYAVAKDLTQSAQVSELVAGVMEKFGKIDILINNAGGYPPEMYEKESRQPLKIWDWTEEKWDRIICTNLKTAFLCTNKIIPHMISAGSGHIINISSRMGRIASEMGAYAAAKSALIALTKTTAIQAEPYGIRVNAVSPGIIDTPGQRAYNKSVDQEGIKMGDAEAVVKAVLYLLCDAPQTMIGQSLDLFRTV
ncbi:MAG: SDR family NAD(P)-dependent oxidoreductase [Bacillota bacterium]